MLIGTHDLQNIRVNSVIVDEVCFQLQYVNGSITNETHLHFVSSNKVGLNFTILRYDRLNFVECITLPVNNWTVYACDEPPCIFNPAITITNITITEVLITLSSTLLSSPSSFLSAAKNIGI